MPLTPSYRECIWRLVVKAKWNFTPELATGRFFKIVKSQHPRVFNDAEAAAIRDAGHEIARDFMQQHAKVVSNGSE